MSKHHDKNIKIKTSGSNISENNDTKTLIIDLGDLDNQVNVIIKGKNLPEPISFVGNMSIHKTIDSPDREENIKAVKALESPSTIETTNELITKHDRMTTREVTVSEAAQIENSQTNSGIINHSQFSDGGFGDIGQQWSKVKLHKANIINNHTSINLTVTGDNTSIHIDRNSFGTDNALAGKKNRGKKTIKKNKDH